MVYLSKFKFPIAEREEEFLFSQKMTCFDTFYPFQILVQHSFEQIDFEPITILYGGNGSGKTTALNVIAETLKLERDTLFNRTSFFETYTKMCDFEVERNIPKGSRIITSDDVFDFMLNLRGINEGIDNRREEMFEDYQYTKHNAHNFKFTSLDDYEELKKINSVRRNTMSKYVRKNLVDNIREHSNGESAFIYFSEKIKENALYILDEPENSLSPEKQIKLTEFLIDSARFYNCQFVIATHSPFILSMKGAKIYDLDEDRVDVKKWTELENVRTYYEFFKKHGPEFEK